MEHFAANCCRLAHVGKPNTIRRLRQQDSRMNDDEIIETPEGPMTWAQWKKKNPVQVPSRRTKGKKLPNKIKRFTGDT